MKSDESDGSPLTVADVKRFIRREAVSLGFDTQDCIFVREIGLPEEAGDR